MPLKGCCLTRLSMKLMISCEQVQLRLLSRFIVSSPFLGGGGSLIEKTDSLLIGLVGRTFKQQNMLNGTESYFSRFGAVGCIRKSRMDVCATQMINVFYVRKVLKYLGRQLEADISPNRFERGRFYCSVQFKEWILTSWNINTAVWEPRDFETRFSNSLTIHINKTMDGLRSHIKNSKECAPFFLTDFEVF